MKEKKMTETELIIHKATIQAQIDANKDLVDLLHWLCKDLEKFANFRREKIELFQKQINYIETISKEKGYV